MRAPTRRIVTEHNAEGVAVFRSDKALTANELSDGKFAATLLWTTAAVPADNNNDFEGERREVGLTLNGGTAFWTTDFGPGSVTPFHRTASVDYGIVISGTIQLELDSGETKDLFPGDVIVQRGTNHLWRNVTEEWCRVQFVLIEAGPIVINGLNLQVDRI